MTIGQKLKQLRTERGWTQSEVARRSGLERGYLAHLEIDSVANPSADTFLKLARAYNIRPEELYVAAGYIREAKTAYDYEENPQQILDTIKLHVRKLEKKLKDHNGSCS